MNKKGSDMLLKQGMSIILFIVLIVISYNVIARVITGGADTQLLQDYNQALEEATNLDPGERTNIILSLPRNSALISMNPLSDFKYDYPDYGFLSTSTSWNNGVYLDRPSACSNLRTCTCLCMGYNPESVLARSQGEIKCDSLICFDGNYTWLERTQMTDVFTDPQIDTIIDRTRHYWINSTIIINSDRQTNTSSTFYYRPSGPRAVSTNAIPIFSGWQGTVGRDMLDVTIIKVGEPNVLRLCVNQNC